jgi:hypothetical protein
MQTLIADSSEEAIMGRKYIDCRETPSEMNCSLRISGTEEEVFDAATQHAISWHDEKDSAELRRLIRESLKDETGEAAPREEQPGSYA